MMGICNVLDLLLFTYCFVSMLLLMSSYLCLFTFWYFVFLLSFRFHLRLCFLNHRSSHNTWNEYELLYCNKVEFFYICNCFKLFAHSIYFPSHLLLLSFPLHDIFSFLFFVVFIASQYTWSVRKHLNDTDQFCMGCIYYCSTKKISSSLVVLSIHKHKFCFCLVLYLHSFCTIG